MSQHLTPEETIALLEATLDATHDGVLVLDLHRRIVRYNRSFLDMFRVPSNIVAGGLKAVFDAVRSQFEDPSAFLLDNDALWERPDAESVDTLTFKDGRIFERFIAPHRLDGKLVGRVVSYRDIGETVRAQATLEQHRAFLEQAQQVAHLGSWVAELDGSDTLGWSAETYRIFGVAPGQFAGTSEAFFGFVHPEDRDAVRAASAAARAERGGYDIEHRILRSDGSIRWVHERADVIRDQDGRAVRMIGTVQDISDRRQLEAQLHHSQKMETLGRLAGGITHDLNNALAAIAGYSELVLGEVGADHPARRDVEEIRRAAERATSVTRQLLVFSRKQLLQPRIFDLNETVSGIARLLSRLLGHDIDVVARLAPALPALLGDPGQVEQAIINLAVNARDAMPTGGRFELATSFEEVDESSAQAHVPMPPGRYVVLRAADNGHGMSRETQARIFEPFFTTKDVGKGTGLGLSIVYGALKQMGGFIFVDSEIDRGTTFHLYFPLAPRADAFMTPEAPQTSAIERERLLVVDEESAVRNLVASALRQEGYRLLLAPSAEEASRLAASQTESIDLLLIDAGVGGDTGIELARALVAERPGLPVVIMSSYVEDPLSVDSLKTRAALLQKPFTPRELRHCIRDILDR